MVNRAMMRKAAFLPLLVLLILVVLDVASTLLGIGVGGIEGNPFGITPLSFLIFKILVPGVLVTVGFLLRNEAGSLRWFALGILGLDAWYGFVVVNNFSVAFALGHS
jgi:hypothetical protein